MNISGRPSGQLSAHTHTHTHTTHISALGGGQSVPNYHC